MTKVKRRPVHLTIVISPGRQAILDAANSNGFVAFRCTDPDGRVYDVGFRIQDLSCVDRSGRRLAPRAMTVPGNELNFTAIDRGGQPYIARCNPELNDEESGGTMVIKPITT